MKIDYHKEVVGDTTNRIYSLEIERGNGNVIKEIEKGFQCMENTIHNMANQLSTELRGIELTEEEHSECMQYLFETSVKKMLAGGQVELRALTTIFIQNL